jgi:hypothetical protein
LRLSVAAAIAVPAALAPARAQTIADGQYVLSRCRDGQPNPEIAAMAGGLSFGLLTGQGLGGPRREYCPPNEGRISNVAAGRAVCRFIADNPKLLTQDAYVAMGIALLKTYSCTPAPTK